MGKFRGRISGDAAGLTRAARDALKVRDGGCRMDDELRIASKASARTARIVAGGVDGLLDGASLEGRCPLAARKRPERKAFPGRVITDCMSED